MAKKTKDKKPPWNADAKGFILIALGALGLLALTSFRYLQPESNWLGVAGYLSALSFEYIFGLSAYLIPLYLFWLGVKFFRGQKLPHLGYDHLYFLILLCSSCIVLSVIAERFQGAPKFFGDRVVSEIAVLHTPYPRTIIRFNLGGAPFYYLFADLPYISLQRILSSTGTALIFTTLGLVAFLLLTRMRLLAIGEGIKRAVVWLIKCWKVRDAKAVNLKQYAGLPSAPSASPPKSASKQYAGLSLPNAASPKPTPKKTAPLADPEDSKPELPPIVNITPPKKEKESIPVPTKQLMVKSDSSYKIPSPSLLTSPVAKIDQPTLKKDLVRQAAILEDTLKSFGIEAKVGEINSGPTITSFEVHPSVGVKVQKIKALENDIALNMQAKSIRIVAPIPGKAAVGVEVPALHPQEVNFKDLLVQYQTKQRKLQIPILIGKAVNGECVFTDLAKMPHCLIAGATGSGKSVCINTIVMSILLNARPDEIKLLMIDPKKVELTQYSHLPHMIAPVITEPHGAYAALQWLVKEMQIRYEILKQLGLRNITAFNNRKINKDLEASLSVPIPEQMQFIVAIVDEFADLMMVSSADLETPIARIAQMARAVGIHLILATQRPSREVITGIIKANIPTRISFKVASRINSQIILDDTGAESLLGNGDLLFLPPGSSQLIRAQGAYISDEDINQVVKYICGQTPTNYLIPSFDAFKALDLGLDATEPKGNDPLYDQALTLVLASKSASTTYLQRKLKIGYARAASLMDELETNGVISAADGAKPRRVLGASSPNVDLLEEEL
jgi:S-DNA-T family DNA segregation ATPase FtsK/SpoIIIE